MRPEFVYCTGGSPAWVHFNVLPHLWGGEWERNQESVRKCLTSWIEGTPGEAVIVTDCPAADFFTQLKWLLSQWPKNLVTWPVQFDSWSMGDEQQPVLQQLMDDYHSAERPRHHALHDANALRRALMYAIENGWRPSYGADT